MGEVVRALRWLNAPVGIAIAGMPWLLAAPASTQILGSVAGLLIAGLAVPRGPVREKYGGWERLIR